MNCAIFDLYIGIVVFVIGIIIIYLLEHFDGTR